MGERHIDRLPFVHALAKAGDRTSNPRYVPFTRNRTRDPLVRGTAVSPMRNTGRDMDSLLFSILGPPFTHQRTPQKMVYFGKSTCKNNCENYIEIIKYVFSAYKRESPLIVNTMGWVTGKPPRPTGREGLVGVGSQLGPAAGAPGWGDPRAERPLALTPTPSPSRRSGPFASRRPDPLAVPQPRGSVQLQPQQIHAETHPQLRRRHGRLVHQEQGQGQRPRLLPAGVCGQFGIRRRGKGESHGVFRT